jgi:hypothetical protein
MKPLAIAATFSSLALSVLGSTAMAQSNAYLLPYGMSAGMQVLNLATRPRPAAAPTPVAPNEADNGYAAGGRRLVCEQWSGNRWVIIHIPAKQCLP